ncbi:hypothetical protein RGU70_06985 [Herbaspirillum sp. RTI4]|uniref:hypothetical protein n=1 Tax=Herbaspirillum sp. RTI4 TaxID=3048640 RepID=UPI002AB50CA3|nr:hypothetical protein [Herbaspirillum sp. RTI4]MDY7578061.1 hypothetical protein [Herbaspirillum sp. RTI4]MEA9983191.1 hypothetical protein [Herbaspirillum sp. RTI4]
MRRWQHSLAAGLLAAITATIMTAAQAEAFRFGVIGHASSAKGEIVLRNAIAASDAANLAFVVVNGIKARSEDCSDALYQQRLALLQEAQNGLIVSIAASDWTTCKNSEGKPAAIERLNQLRELLFADSFSLGASRLPLIRQSATPKFRAYAENARWEVGGVLFATIHLPSDNNHYLSAGGRNSEFEDRQIANHEWLQRLFALAALKKLHGIVLFSDGDPWETPTAHELQRGQRDGFASLRQNLLKFSGEFHGRVMLIHGKTDKSLPPAGIVWRRNLGELGIGPGWISVQVDPTSPGLFSVAKPATTNARP